MKLIDNGKTIVVSLTGILVVVLSLSNIYFAYEVEDYINNNVYSYNTSSEEGFSTKNISYNEYVGYYYKPDVFSRIEILSDDIYEYEGEFQIFENHEGYDQPSALVGDRGYVSWEFDVKHSGLYEMTVDYFPYKGNGIPMEREILINGEKPYREAGNVKFNRLFIDSGKPLIDIHGNEIRPEQIEKRMWMTRTVYDSSGLQVEPLKFYLNEGLNTVTFIALREPMIIGKINLEPSLKREEYIVYDEINREKGLKEAEDKKKLIEGESALYKSDPTLFPLHDSTSPATSPYKGSKIVLNTIGGNNWAHPNQFLVWEFHIEEAGLYNLSIKFRQNIRRGITSTRRIYVNGEVPFKELENVEFEYSNRWKKNTLGDEDAYLIYFKEGTNRIKMENTFGIMGSIIESAQESLYNINAIYREIIQITGVNPDPLRDYNLDRRLPDTMQKIIEESQALEDLFSDIEELTGGRVGESSIINTLANQLNDFYENPHRIPLRLNLFKGNSGALGTWINNSRIQPLEIDYFVLHSSDTVLKNPNAGIFARIKHFISQYINSYFLDYNSIGNMTKNDEQPITVWISTGRDQWQTLKQQIDTSFTRDYGINVQLNLVNINSLLPATVARIGPDLALGVPQSEPINYAIRNGIVDLSTFEGFDEIIEHFHHEMLVPFTFKGGIYALPETVGFPMLFYREDILLELGLKVPETWEEVIAMISIINKSNLEFGLPVSDAINPGGGLITFFSLLMQNGGELYNDGGISSALNTPQAIRAFRIWTNFYINYQIPLQLDFQNRFRTGEIPIGIWDYSLYNILMIAAPEIRGLWNFAPVPGIRRSDGTIDRTAPLTVTGCVILEQSDRKDDAWEFLKWWMSSETQRNFGRSMESILGPSARYPTANKTAFGMLPWSHDEMNTLEKQIDYLRGMPEVPGGYLLPRIVNNAFRSVVIQGEPAQETLLEYVFMINNEIDNKRREFGLKVAD